MLEYFTYKKVKKHNAEKKDRVSNSNTPLASPTPASPTTSSKPRHLNTVKSPSADLGRGGASPILNDEDEYFLHRFISAEGTPPPLPQRKPTLPARPSERGNERITMGDEAGEWRNNELQMILREDGDGEEVERENETRAQGKGKDKMGEEGEKIDDNTEKVAKKWKRLSFLHRGKKEKDAKATGLQPDPNISDTEAQREQDDLSRVLDDLSLTASNNRAFSLSPDSTVLVQKFTFILKDLINGVPTAYDDLVHLLEDSQGTLSKSYDSLPSFLQKLITQLPQKVTTTLAPELLAVATEAQAHSVANAASAAQTGGMGAAAKSFLTPSSLKDLVTKPGAVVGMLKAIVNALKLRWPAFMGTNVLLSLALFVLLFVFWYCYKRGKEVRLARDGRVLAEGEGLTPGEGGSRELSREGSRREGGGSSDGDGYKARRDARQREKEIRKEEESSRSRKSEKERK
ncbi:putative ring-like domain-containing protein [Botrytis fragariae]|uniref:Putative ring-like domain-containing protein n=1 Tax=Botrytis fragariae TaxID=1964551 RepID=A0A8H6B3A2_9HELO|nr:putative ring-like domain-containing protein [Botrytis fragariae]KAF5878574.1 putative ring-like domain-containing protein [Botrytis fragariae]